MTTSEVILDAQSRLHARGKERLLLWRTSISTAISDPGFLNDNAASISVLLADTLNLYDDQPSKRAVKRVIDVALLSDSFLKAFAGVVLKQCSGKPVRNEAFVLLTWTCALLSHLDVTSAKKAVAKLIEVQVSLFNALNSSHVRWSVVSRPLRALLRKKPALRAEYVQAASGSDSFGLIKALLDYGRSDNVFFSEHKDVFITLYVDKVLGAKEKLPSESIDAFALLIKSLTDAELATKVMPSIIRLLRRTPETILTSTTAMLHWLDLDISPHAKELFIIILQHIRTKESLRSLAVAAVGALAAKIKNPVVLGELTALVGHTLDGSAEGKIRSPQERLALVTVLSALCEAPGAEEGFVTVAKTASGFLSTYYKDEVSEDVKLALLSSLSQWGCRCMELPASAGLLFVAGLKDAKETVRKAHLRVVAQLVCNNVATHKQLVATMESLVKVVNDGITKAAMRADGLIALSAAVCLAAVETSADVLMEKEKIWSNVLKPDSVLLSASTVAKLAPSEAPLVATLAEALLLKHLSQLAKGGTEVVSQLLAAALVHHHSAARKAAAASASTIISSQSGAFSKLVNGLQFWMECTMPCPTLQDPSADDSAQSPAGSPARFGEAVIALTPSAPLKPQELAALLLVAHHPAAVGERLESYVWHRVKRVAVPLNDLTPDAVTAICNHLVGEHGLQSSSSKLQLAAQRSLGAVMALAPEELYPQVMEVLGEMLDKGEHEDLSVDDIDIYETPEGTLVSERPQKGVYVPEVVESKNVRKPRGRYKSGNSAFGAADDYEDDEPVSKAPPAAPLTRPSAGATAGGRGGRGGGAGGRGKGKDPKDRQEEMRQQRLAYESKIRSGILKIKAKLELGLTTLLAVATGNKRFTTERLEEFAAPCLPLLSSPVVGGAAFTAVNGLCGCLPGALGARATSVAASLRMVVMARQGLQISYTDIPKSKTVADVVNVLSQVTEDETPLPSSAYSFIFPIIEAVLSSPVHTPLHDKALEVLTLHVSPGSVIPRGETLILLYQLLEVIPAQRDKVQPILQSLCAGSGSKAELKAALSGILSRSAMVRAACMEALPCVPTIGEGVCLNAPDISCVLYIAKFDTNEANQDTADILWRMAGCDLPINYVEVITQQLASPHEDVRAAAGSALAQAMILHTSTRTSALQAVIASYADGETSQAARRGVAAGLGAIAASLAEGDMSDAMHFLISKGLADQDSRVREDMVAAGMAIVDARGASNAKTMLPLFETFLNKSKQMSAEEEARYDLVREGVVVFLGTLARHLPREDPKRRVVLTTLIDVLSTPSEGVQRAVSNCLGPLMEPLKQDKAYSQQLITQLLERLLGPGTYGERRGAAYGLAGVVKGLGIVVLKGYSIMERLKSAIENKLDPKHREGALLAFECLSLKLGRLFEPYVILVLPLLLNCFGDVVLSVRQATEDASRTIMGQLTAAGVKLVLPALLRGLEDKLWRTKQGSIQLLGAMAYCAPKQLGTCLPTIVPRLSEVLSDPHPKVQAAGQEALSEVGSVIRSPEIQSLVPHLLAAISNPNKDTKPCLDTLLGTTFINTIDAPSLSLIVPVVHRGLRDRSGDTKKRASRIVGNMCSLVNDPRDMQPYVPVLMPQIQKALVDPLPDVRATAARAMGSLLHGMGQESFENLLPWLMETLKSDSSSVERSGAAQGLAEVLAVLGHEYLESLLPDLMAACHSKNPLAREGHLTLFRYLPQTMEETFQDHLPKVLPFILDGLSDEVEGVRDAALSAGRTFVDLYAVTAMPYLLPAVERGVFNDNWRIRQSSVELIGELLYKVAGTSGKVVVDGGSDDEGAATEFIGRAIVEKLGHDRRAQVLARLYIARSDVQYTVRNAALHVWKTLVVNTPKTLSETLPELMQQVISLLADEGEDRKQTAARCLGELVRKMGDRVLAKIVPILKKGMESPESAQRQGVCFGLKEVLENISRQQLLEYLNDMLPPVQAGLCDDDPLVREAAGGAFGILFKGGAGSAVDSVVPSLLGGIDIPGKYNQSLEGLRVILGVRPQTLNAIVPRLLRPPMLTNNIRALGALADVAGPALQNHLSTIFNTLLPLAGKKEGGSLQSAAEETAASVALAVEEEAVHILMTEFQKGLEDPGKRRGGVVLTAKWAKATKHDFEEHVPTLITSLVVLLAEEDQDVVMSAWKALESVTATVPKESQANLVRCMKDAVSSAREKERRKRRGGPLLVAGFCVPPKALSPVLPIYLQGVLQGRGDDVREMAAEALGELVEVTSAEALRPFVIQITGPLIRIVGDRFASAIKAAILVTLGLINTKAGPSLKPFVPQLQTTYLKCLHDPADNVRHRAAANLGQLTKMSLRVDQLATELVNAAKMEGDPQVRQAFLLALGGTLLVSGERLQAATLAHIGSSLLANLQSAGDDETMMIAIATALAVYCRHCPLEDLRQTLEAGPLGIPPNSWLTRYGHAVLLATTCSHCGDRLGEAGILKPSMDAVVRYARDEKIQIRVAAGHAAARLIKSETSAPVSMINVMGALLGPDQNSEVQRQAMLALRKVPPAVLEPHLSVLVPSMCAMLQSTAGPTKSACERTLVRVLQLDVSLDLVHQYLATSPGGTVRSALTEPFLRRMQKLSPDDDELDVEQF